MKQRKGLFRFLFLILSFFIVLTMTNLLTGCGDDKDSSPSTNSISGQVTYSNGNAFSGVTMRLSGSASKTTTTDSNGNYSFSDLTGCGSDYYWTVTPSRSGYSFNWTSQSVSSSACTTWTGIDFKAN